MATNSRPLVIVDRYPLPAVTGGRQRMWNFLLAIDSMGPADLVVLERAAEASIAAITEALPLWSVHTEPIAKRRRSGIRRVIEVLANRAPSGFGRLDMADIARRLLPMAADRGLIVAIQPIAAQLAIAIRPNDSRVAVDLWDVEDARLSRIIAAKPPTQFRWPRAAWDWLRDRLDVRAWRRFNARLVESAELVTVCSDVDQRSLQPSTVVRVIANGADLRPESERGLNQPPVILYHGQLTYPPNAEAAQILSQVVLPIVRSEIPDACARIVGRADDRVLRLAAPPSVVVTGFVDDIEVELARADVLIVPLRVGGGTRLKILEAFSAGLPVVSTTVGAEGLDVTDRRELLIADTPAAMAAAAIEFLRDADLRQNLTSAARALVRERYDWTIIRSQLVEALAELV